MRLVLLGPPGAGKGTLANLLKERLNVAHISTGDILRQEMKDGSSLGQEAKSFIERGDLVPDELVTRLIESVLKNNANTDKGYMLDGFPRTKQQAEDLSRILKEINQPIEYAIYLDSTLPVVLKRLTGRRVCRNCGALYHMENKPSKVNGICDECEGPLYQRPDDNETTIKTRMEVYVDNTQPIVTYYDNEGLLQRVDADKDASEVESILMKIFDENSAKN